MIIKNPLTIVSTSGITWTIIPSMVAPVGDGNPGDIFVITSEDVSNVRSVSYVDMSYDAIESDAVNLIVDTNALERRLQTANKWHFGGKFSGNVVNIGGSNKAVTVYIWDTITNTWVVLGPAFIDTIAFSSWVSPITVPDIFGAFGMVDTAVVSTLSGGQVYP